MGVTVFTLAHVGVTIFELAHLWVSLFALTCFFESSFPLFPVFPFLQDFADQDNASNLDDDGVAVGGGSVNTQSLNENPLSQVFLL